MPKELLPVAPLTAEQVRRVLMVIADADNGCASCVYDLLERLKVALPSHDWAAEFETCGKGYAGIRAWKDAFDYVRDEREAGRCLTVTATGEPCILSAGHEGVHEGPA